MIFCLVLSFKNPSLVELSVTNGVGSWRWTISSRGILRAASCLQFKNNAPSYAYIALARTFFIVVHSMCKGLLSGGGLWGGFFGSDDGSLRQ